MDPKTIQKIKFVTPKNKDSVDLMKTFFDFDNLPKELGGIANMEYDHEEFSRQMAQDDIKTAEFWDVDEKISHKPSLFGAITTPEPLALSAS